MLEARAIPSEVKNLTFFSILTAFLGGPMPYEMLRYEGKSECISHMEKANTIIKPIDSRLIQPNVEACNML